MKQSTPIHLLRSFEAAARHTSFTLAAEELNITQAAVSKQIRSLEKRLNSLLFNRNAHSVSLTQAGERYWQDTRVFINQIDNVTRQLFDLRATQNIRIRANISYSVEVLAEKIGWFQTHYPDLTVELTHSVWNRDAQPDNADIEIDYRRINPAETTYALLHQDQMYPVVANKLTYIQSTALPTIHILGYYKEWNWWLTELLSRPDISEKFKTWAQLKLEEINTNTNIIRVDNSLIAYKLCVKGIGVALARSCLVQTYIENRSLKRLINRCEISAREGFHLYMTETGQSKKTCRAFADYLKNNQANDPVN